MFFLWVKITSNAAQIPKAINKGSLRLNTQIKDIGNMSAADIELKDTKRVANNIVKNISKQAKALK